MGGGVRSLKLAGGPHGLCPDGLLRTTWARFPRIQGQAGEFYPPSVYPIWSLFPVITSPPSSLSPVRRSSSSLSGPGLHTAPGHACPIRWEQSRSTRPTALRCSQRCVPHSGHPGWYRVPHKDPHPLQRGRHCRTNRCRSGQVSSGSAWLSARSGLWVVCAALFAWKPPPTVPAQRISTCPSKGFPPTVS